MVARAARFISENTLLSMVGFLIAALFATGAWAYNHDTGMIYTALGNLQVGVNAALTATQTLDERQKALMDRVNELRDAVHDLQHRGAQ